VVVVLSVGKNNHALNQIHLSPNQKTSSLWST
jgi:hypothetical protein